MVNWNRTIIQARWKTDIFVYINYNWTSREVFLESPALFPDLMCVYSAVLGNGKFSVSFVDLCKSPRSIRSFIVVTCLGGVFVIIVLNIFQVLVTIAFIIIIVIVVSIL